MADLFDIVKAAPPPTKVRDSPKQINPARIPSPACSLPPPVSSPLSDNSQNGGENALLSPTKRAIVRLKRFSLQEGADSQPYDENFDLFAQNVRSCLTKTKAQQKQFDDEVPLSGSDSNIVVDSVKSKIDQGTDNAKKCRVRLKRLSDIEIAQYASQSKKKRGRPKKNRDIETTFVKPASESPIKPSSAQKRKMNSSEPTESLAKKREKCSTPIHFKLSGPKSSKLISKIMRRLTPPPAASTPIIKSIRGKKLLIKQYGTKVFRSYVHMERCKHPIALSFEAIERARKSRRPNLSVSFRDAVEIIGQSADMCSSVPTRLTKVENGKVVESTLLDQGGFLMPSPVTATTSLGSAKKHRKKRDTSDKINSSRRATKTSRHSGERLPLSGMARLRIDDDAPIDEDEENDEYIVPTDLPVSMPTTINISTKIKDKSPNLEAATKQEANIEEQPSRQALKSPLPPSPPPPPPSPKPSTSVLSFITDKETTPYKIATQEQSHDELSDTNKCKTEEITKATTLGPTPRRALKSPTPLKEEADQDNTENDEAANVASTNITPTKSVVADEMLAAPKQTEKLRTLSVDSDTSFCSAKDVLEDVNGSTNRERKLKSPTPTTDTSISVKETEEDRSLATDVLKDETESVTEQEIPKKPNGLEQDEITTDSESPVECLILKSEFSSSDDDDDSDATIRRLVVEDTDDCYDKADDDTSTRSSMGIDKVEQPKLNVALLNPPKITRKSPTPTGNDEPLQEIDDTLILHQDEDDEICLNLREQESDFTATTGSLVEDLMKALDP